MTSISDWLASPSGINGAVVVRSGIWVQLASGDDTYTSTAATDSNGRWTIDPTPPTGVYEIYTSPSGSDGTWTDTGYTYVIQIDGSGYAAVGSDETITGDWTFETNPDITGYAQLDADQTITGEWTFSTTPSINGLPALDEAQSWTAIQTYQDDTWFKSGRPWVDPGAFGVDFTGTDDSTAAMNDAIATLGGWDNNDSGATACLRIPSGMVRLDTPTTYYTDSCVVTTVSGTGLVTLISGTQPAQGQFLSIPDAGADGATLVSRVAASTSTTITLDAAASATVASKTATITATSLLYFDGVTDLTVEGVGTGTILQVTTAKATEFVRFSNCGRLKFRNVQLQVTGTAQITHAVHYTVPNDGSAHDPVFSDVHVTSIGDDYGAAMDAFTNPDNTDAYVFQATTAFTDDNVGGYLCYNTSTGPVAVKISAVATLTGTTSAAMTDSQTTVSLEAAISGAPDYPYPILIGDEELLVTDGFQTTTLTVTRGYNFTTAATQATHSTVTTYQATLTSDVMTSSSPDPITWTQATDQILHNCFAVGADQMSSGSLDLAVGRFRDCKATYYLRAGWEMGNGTSGNTLDWQARGCSAGVGHTGVNNNAASLRWDGENLDDLGIAYKVSVPCTDVFRLGNFRCENVGRLYDCQYVGGIGSVKIEDVQLWNGYSPDAQVIRHLGTAGVLTLDDVNVFQLVGATLTPQFTISGADAANPVYVLALNVGVTGGDPFVNVDSSDTAILNVIGSASNVNGEGFEALGTHGNSLGDHLSSTGPAPTVAAGSNAGTSPPTPGILTTAVATDTRGAVEWGTGTSPAAGAQVVITFAHAYPAAPAPPMVTPMNAATAKLELYVTSVSTTGFTIAAAVAPTASEALGTYEAAYLVMG